MKTKLKRILCAVLTLVTLTSVMPIGFGASAAAEVKGMEFKKGNIHTLDKALIAEPKSFSATIKIAEDTTGAPGVIFGNYKNDKTSFINLEILEGGIPAIRYMDKDGTLQTVSFDDVSVATGELVTLTVSIDTSSVYCYIGTELKATAATSVSYATDAFTANDFVVGGDARDEGTRKTTDDNANYFKGTINSLGVYSVALTAGNVSGIITSGVNSKDVRPIAYYDMTKSKAGLIEDLSGNGCHASAYYQRESETDDYAYSFAIVGDTQTAVYWDVYNAYNKSPEGGGTQYTSYEEAIAAQKRLSYVYDWIVDNKDQKKIQYVFGVGDITENQKTSAWDWDLEFAHAKSQIQKLDKAGIPYTLIPGDHDEANRHISGYSVENGTRDYSKFNEYFGDCLSSRITGYYKEGEYTSYYVNFEVGETEYMLLALEVAAPNRVLDWANEVVKANPDRKVIITTHSYLWTDGTRVGTSTPNSHNTSGSDGENIRNNGEMIWDELVKLHSNIVMVISGHEPCSDLVMSQAKGVNGNVVTQILVNPQYMEANEGMVCMLYFSEDGNDVRAEWIAAGYHNDVSGYPSTKKDVLYRSKNQFSFSLDGKSRVSAHTDKTAILSNPKLLTNGLQAYTDFGNWEETDIQSSALGNVASSKDNAKLYGVQGTNTYLNFLNSTINKTSFLVTDAFGNKYVKLVSSNDNKNLSQKVIVGNAYDRTKAYGSVAKDFAGNSFIYQTDIKTSDFTYTASPGSTGLMVRTWSVSSGQLTKTLVGYNLDGSLCLAGGSKLRDKNGNAVYLSTEDFNTIAVLVNPGQNRYWVMLDGKVINEDGYEFLTKEDMKTLVNADDNSATYLYDSERDVYLDKDGNETSSPVPYEYLLSEVLFTHKGGISTPYDVCYDNTMLYFVDDTFTYDDYLKLLEPVAGTSATLGSEIGYNYYLRISDTFLAENPSLEAVFDINGVRQVIKIADAVVTNYDVDGDGKVDNFRKVTCKVPVAEMTCEIKMTLRQGFNVYEEMTSTVKEYADKVASGSDTVAANAAKSLLLYGAYAQAYFGVNTDKPAASLDIIEMKALPTEKGYSIEGSGSGYLGSRLMLRSSATIVHYFSSIEGLTFTLDGTTVLTPVKDGSDYRIDIEGIVASDLDRIYSLKVSDGENEYTINYSAVGYAQLALESSEGDELKDLVRAMYTYNFYADEYVNAK